MKPFRHCCKNCHFLTKTTDPRNGGYRFTWSKEDREKMKISEHYSAECGRGIWSTGIDPKLNTKISEILVQNRKDTCFFIEHNDGLSFSGARELHRLRSANHQLRKSYRYTQWGLWIAALGLLVTTFITILEFLRQ